MQTMTYSVEPTKMIPIEIFKEKIQEVCSGFEVDDDNRELINSIYLYANEQPGLLDPNKGILLWGTIGTGKSTIIKIVGEVLRIKKQGFITVNCSLIATQYSATGLQALNSSTYNDSELGPKPVNRAFDELGREPIPAMHYGNALNVMQYILQCRYELKGRIKTFATTNLKPESFEKLYGTYIADRMNEMFNIVEVKGKSRRK